MASSSLSLISPHNASTATHLILRTGSTAAFVISKLVKLLKSDESKDIIGVPTSKCMEDQARQLGIPLSVLTRRSTALMRSTQISIWSKGPRSSAEGEDGGGCVEEVCGGFFGWEGR
ncbi:hypothetical protein EV1_020804 [Malus domestica]